MIRDDDRCHERFFRAITLVKNVDCRLLKKSSEPRRAKIDKLRLSMSCVKAINSFSRRLAHFLSCNVGQVMGFIIRFMISPHHKNNFQPLRSQSSKCLGMAMSSSALVAIKGLGPLAAIYRDKSKPVEGVAQWFVTRKPKLNNATLATGLGHRDCSRLSLKVLEGLPSIWSISQLGPKHWQQRSAFSSRQLLHKPSGRCRGEKTFNLVAVLLYCSQRSLKLIEQHFEQLRLGS